MNESALYTYQQERFKELRARLVAFGRISPPVLDVDYGWVTLLNDMLDELEAADPTAVITRIYNDGGSLMIHGTFSQTGHMIVDQYLNEAMITCEVTGRQDAKWYNDTGRMRTLSPSYVASLSDDLRSRITEWDG
jgi:hypothetical protein